LLALVLAHHLLCALPGWLAGRMLLRRAPAETQVLLAWALALACAEALRPLGWWGHGYGALATALVDAPGSRLLLPWLSGLGWAGSGCACAQVSAHGLAGWAGPGGVPRLVLGSLLLAAGLGALGLRAHRDAAASPPGPGGRRHRHGPGTGHRPRPRRPVDARRPGRGHGPPDARPGPVARRGVLATAETYLPQSAPESPLGAWGELLAAVAARQGHVLLGMPQWVRQGEAAAYPVNAVRHLAPTRQAVYGKARPVPLGEYLPDTRWSRPLAQWLFASARGNSPPRGPAGAALRRRPSGGGADLP
jgi:apolipoprotein N-acyltransferase